MKKQLLIITNTLILTFGISSCGKKNKNSTDVKRSLKLNVVETSLEQIQPPIPGHSNLAGGYWEDKLFWFQKQKQDTGDQTMLRTGITVYGDQPFETDFISTMHDNASQIKGLFKRENINSHYSETTQPIMSLKDDQVTKIQLTSWSHIKGHIANKFSYPFYSTWPNWKKFSPKSYKEDGILLKFIVLIKKYKGNLFFKRTAVFGQENRDKLLDFDHYDKNWSHWISGEENYELFTAEMANEQFFKPGIKITNDKIYLTLSYNITNPENNVAYYPLSMYKTNLISRWDNIPLLKWT